MKSRSKNFETLDQRTQEFIARANKIKTEQEFRNAVAEWVNNLSVEEKLIVFKGILYIYPYQKIFSNPNHKIPNSVNVVLSDVIKELSYLGLDPSIRPQRRKRQRSKKN